MLPAKYLNGNAVLAIPAYTFTEIQSNDEPESEVGAKRNARKPRQNNSKKDSVNSRELCGV